MSSLAGRDDEIRRLLTEARTIAVVGASSKSWRPSHGIMRRLLDVGYRVIPVNPHEREVLGEKAYARLRDVPEAIDIVDVFRRWTETPAVAHDAVAVGARCLWLQSGVVNEEAARIATAGGLVVVMDACIAVVHTVLAVPPK
jgi:predicted CoA-binding protein